MATGSGQTTFTITVKENSRIAFTITVQVDALTGPQDVLVADMKTGFSAYVSWDTPASGAVDHYDVYVASSLTAPLVKDNIKDIADTHYIVSNRNLSETIYIKVAAVGYDGTEVFSDFGEDAVLTKPTTTLRITAPVGDTLVNKAILAAEINGELIGFRLPQQVDFN